MKVLWLAPYPLSKLSSILETVKPVKSHPATWIDNLSDELSKINNVEFHLLSYSSAIKKNQSFIHNNINFHILKYSFPFTHKGYPSFLPLDTMFNYSSLIKRSKIIIEQIKPDIIHSYGTEGPYSLMALKSGFPYIISMQGIIHFYYKTDKSIYFFLQKGIEKKTVIESHFFDCRTDIDTAFVRKTNPNALVFHIPRVTKRIFYEKKWFGFSDTILFVGLIHQRKGLEILFKALQILKNKNVSFNLNIIGYGDKEYIDSLKSIANNCGIDSNINWLGRKEQDYIANELSNSRVFVIPSLMDNSPNSLSEAMAAGIPCIASRVGGIPSMIKNNFDGMLYDKDDFSTLANNLEVILKDDSIASEFSKNARYTSLKRNYPDVVVEKVIGAYSHILKKK